jgi:spore coat polysaccharide biosynthesis protein SpsF
MQHITEENDYTSNVDPATFPDGLDVEVMNFSVLQDAWVNAKLSSDKEHVTPYIRNNIKFKKGTYASAIDFSKYRWTVDEARDFDFVTKIYTELSKEGEYFGSDEIYKLLDEQPMLQEINSDIMRNEGYKKSLEKDFLQGIK